MITQTLKPFLYLITIIIFLGFFAIGTIGFFKINKTKVQLETLKEVENQTNNEKFNLLVQCESSNNELAINRKDSDGTASFGLLQWKPETFRGLAIKYGIIGEKADWNWIMTLVFDRRVNKKIFVEVMRDKTENPYLLWPNCCKKVGCGRG